MQGENNLAKDTFTISQGINYMEPESWFGQALLTELCKPLDRSNITIGYQQAVDIKPCLVSRKALGFSAFAEGNYSLAMVTLYQCVYQDNTDVTSLNILGLALEAIGMPLQASRAFREAMSRAKE